MLDRSASKLGISSIIVRTVGESAILSRSDERDTLVIVVEWLA